MRMRQVWITLFLFILLSMSVYAYDDMMFSDGGIPQRFIREDGYYSYAPLVSGFSNPDFDQYVTSANTAARFPIVSDLDLDGTLEIVTMSGTSLKVSRLIGKSSISTIGEYTLVANSDSWDVVAANNTAWNRPVILVNNYTHILAFNFTGTNVYLINTTSAESAYPGMMNCREDDCFIVANTSMSHALVRYNISNSSVTYVGPNIQFQAVFKPLAIDDIRNDNHDDVFFAIHFNESVPPWIYKYSIDTNITLNTSLNRTMAAPSFYRIGNSSISQIVSYDTGDGGFKELFLNVGVTSLNNGYEGVMVLEDDLTVNILNQKIYTYNTGTAKMMYPMGMVFGSIFSDDDVCRNIFYSGSVKSLSCMSLASGLSGQVYLLTNNPLPSGSYLDDTLGAYDFNNDGYKELYTNYGIINMTNLSNSSLKFSNIFPNTDKDTTYNLSIWTVPVDIYNNDGQVEMIKLTSTNTYIYFSDEVANNPPNIWNNLTYGGYGSSAGYSSPICINTTVTYSAAENTNYDNDNIFDQERIVTNCGMNALGVSLGTDYTTNIDNGTYSDTTPSFSCYFNVTGTYYLRLYLQDNHNTSDYSQYNIPTITVNVINGVPGSTCNVADVVNPGDTEEVTTTTDDSTQTDQQLESLFNILTGNNSNTKLFISIILILCTAFFAQRAAGSVYFSIFAGILAMIFCLIVGLFPVWIFILLMITLLIIITILYMLTKNTSGG